MMKDNVKINSNFNNLEVKCFSCGKNDHYLKFCPLISYIPEKIDIIKNFVKSQESCRVNYRRSFFKKKTFNFKNFNPQLFYSLSKSYSIWSQKNFKEESNLSTIIYNIVHYFLIIKI